ncbi:MAG: hypothetical protein A2252_10000 [Elusimicrobia bacterium RIFOXYA2_FULL_39_19]|nr:MAG: hypothetical protein A2252_10000 [Elusimicrobia bacterium RIFOXYA2_FULL_39_19]
MKTIKSKTTQLNTQKKSIVTPYLNNYYGIIILFTLLIIYFFVSFFKINQFIKLPSFNLKDDTALFWTESSFQYRYAKMIAYDIEIPRMDYKAQYPEGVDTNKELTIFMEKIHGYIYKTLSLNNKIPFHVFLIYFICFFSSLSIISVYLVVNLLWDNKKIALLVSFFYATSPSSFGRIITGIYGYEDFALPFIFFSIYFVLKIFSNSKNSIYAFLAASFLSIALASWHFSIFYFIVFVLTLYIMLFYYRGNADKVFSFNFYMLFLITLFVLGSIFSYLRLNRFLFSIPMLFLYIFGLFYISNKTVRKIAIIVTSVSLLIIAILVKGLNYTSYGHVYSLFVYKLLFFLQKPVDPSLLNIEARGLWIEDFNSPTWGYLIHHYLPISLICIYPLFKSTNDLMKKKIETKELFLFISVILWFVLFIFVRRIGVFFIWFIVIFIGKHLFLNFKHFKNGKKATTITTFLILGLMCFQYFQFVNGIKAPNIYDKIIARLFLEKPEIKVISGQDCKLLIRWIKTNSSKDDIFLANIGLSPVILTNTDRSIVLNPKYESYEARKKVNNYAFNLYEKEEVFYDLCKKWNVKYYVYQIDNLLDTTKDSLRYYANKLSVEKNSAAYIFHFRPKALKHFILVKQFKTLRVYKVIEDNKLIYKNNYVSPYNPMFDIAVFGGDENKYENKYNDSTNLINLEKLLLTEKMKSEGNQCVFENKYYEGLQYYLAILQNGFPDASIYSNIAQCYYELNMIDKAQVFIKKGLETDENDASLHSILGIIYYTTERYDDALVVLKKAAIIDPENSNNLVNIGNTYLKKGFINESIEYYRKAIEIDSENEAAKRNLAVVLQERKENNYH